MEALLLFWMILLSLPLGAFGFLILLAGVK